jgi:sugar lactone lactonase YvrE
MDMKRLQALLAGALLALASTEALALPPLPPAGTGDLFIASFSALPNGAIFARAPDGTLSTVIMPYPQINALAFQNPSTLLVGSEWSAFRDIERIRLNPDGSVQSQSALLTGLSRPEAMAFDSHGVLYVSDFGLAQIQRVTFAPDGSVLTRGLFATTPHASGLAFGPSGNLFVTEAATDDVERLTVNPGGGFGGRTVLAGGFFNLGALAFDRTGKLFVGYQHGIDLLLLNPDESVASRTHIWNIENVTALAFDGTGDLFAAVGIAGGNAVHELTLDPAGRVVTDQNILSVGGPNALAFQPGAPPTIPEPPSWVLLLTAVAGLAMVWRLRQSWGIRARPRRCAPFRY